MKFKELKAQVKKIGLNEMREETDNYLEAVFVKDMIGYFCQALEAQFGSPVWPPEKKLPSRVTNIIEEFGGVSPGQTLYFHSQDNNIVFAMLWPWSDGIHITIKVVQQKK